MLRWQGGRWNNAEASPVDVTITVGILPASGFVGFCWLLLWLGMEELTKQVDSSSYPSEGAQIFYSDNRLEVSKAPGGDMCRPGTPLELAGDGCSLGISLRFADSNRGSIATGVSTPWK